jgi:hypothetical protein
LLSRTEPCFLVLNIFLGALEDEVRLVGREIVDVDPVIFGLLISKAVVKKKDSKRVGSNIRVRLLHGGISRLRF